MALLAEVIAVIIKCCHYYWSIRKYWSSVREVLDTWSMMNKTIH